MDNDNIQKNYKYMHDDYKIKSLRIMLPKTSTYINIYDGETKWMYFIIDDNELLKKI